MLRDKNKIPPSRGRKPLWLLVLRSIAHRITFLRLKTHIEKTQIHMMNDYGHLWERNFVYFKSTIMDFCTTLWVLHCGVFSVNTYEQWFYDCGKTLPADFITKNHFWVFEKVNFRLNKGIKMLPEPV